MIIVSPSLILSPSDEFPPYSPVIGYDSIVTTATIGTDTEDPLFPASNLANVSTGEVWLAADASEQHISITPAGADWIDYIGIARHNIGSAQIPISIEQYDGYEWAELVPPSLLATDEPLLFRFEANQGAPTRARLQTGDAPATAAVVYAGRSLVLPPNIQVPFTPINYGRLVDDQEDVSESGHFLGRQVFGETRESAMNLSMIDSDWYRQKMDPFIASGVRRPFFVAWNPLRYPREVGFCWFKPGNVPKPREQTIMGHMQIELQMRGIA